MSTRQSVSLRAQHARSQAPSAAHGVRFVQTADRFDRIAAVLRKAGTPIPSNDIWIAAHVFESGAEFVTFDRQFEHVPGLTWVLLDQVPRGRRLDCRRRTRQAGESE